MGKPDFETARLTVRLGAIAENYRRFRAMVSRASVSGVVKADSYGLGMAEAAHTLAIEGCDTFFVARLEEGIALRSLVPPARIFVLDGAGEDTASALVAHRLTPVLNSLDEIAAWSAEAGARNTKLDCAIHLDTGMSRLGLPAGELATLAAEWRQRLAHLNVVLWMSHLACGDNAQSAMNAQQRDRFRAALARLPPAPASLAASGGALLGADYHFDLIRPGIGLYGGNPRSHGENPMRAAAALTGKILQVRRIDRGESVGYGATFRAGRPSTLATIGLGYADGLMRAIGKDGHAAIAGTRIPFAGRVSMDLATLDVTDIPNVKVGDEVEVFGDTVSLEEFAGNAGTVNYEILTRMGTRVPRHYEAAP